MLLPQAICLESHSTDVLVRSDSDASPAKKTRRAPRASEGPTIADLAKEDQEMGNFSAVAIEFLDQQPASLEEPSVPDAQAQATVHRVLKQFPYWRS